MKQNLLLVYFTILSLNIANAQKAYVDGTPLKVCNSGTHAVTASIGHSGNFDGLELSSDGSKLLAYNETLNRAYIINAANDAIIDSCNFTGFIGGLVFGPGNTLYYSGNPTTRIYKLDWSTKALVDSSATFSSGTAFMKNRPGTSEIWVAIDNKLHSFSQSSMVLTAINSNVPGSQYIASGITFNQTGTTVYYASKPNGGQGKLYKMDAATKAIQDSLLSPDWHGNLKALTVSNDTTLYIAYFGLWPNEPSKIYLGKSNNMAGGLLDSVTTAHKPFAMVEKPGSDELWVVYHYDGKVGILNKTANLAAMDSIVVGTNPKVVVFAAGSTSVAQTTENKIWSVYPNPGNGLYYVVAKADKIQYTVTDITGRKVVSGTVSKGQPVDITNTQPGIYYLRLTADSMEQIFVLEKK